MCCRLAVSGDWVRLVVLCRCVGLRLVNLRMRSWRRVLDFGRCLNFGRSSITKHLRMAAAFRRLGDLNLRFTAPYPMAGEAAA